MDVSVIIVNYNTTKFTVDCIKSIRDNTEEVSYEIIVVDNGSSDNAEENLKREFGSDIRFIDAEDNLGFGRGNNLGSQTARGKYLFFLNPDTLLLNNAIKILYDYLDAHPVTAVAGGEMFLPDGTPVPSYSTAFDTPEDEEKNANWLCMLSGRIKNRIHLINGENKNASDNHPFQVAYIFGADMMVRNEAFREVNGFDPDFFMYAEEAELSWRLHSEGYDLVCVPQARIIHFEGASTQSDGSFNEKQYRLRMNGKMIYYQKCFGEEGLNRF